MISNAHSTSIRPVQTAPAAPLSSMVRVDSPLAPRTARREASQPSLVRGLQPARAQASAGTGGAGRPGGNPFGDGFAGRLLHATARDHGALSKHPLIAQLKGTNSAEPYAQLLHDKLAFYSALEELLPQCAADPVVAALLAVPHLPRAARLQADLKALGAAGQPSAAARAYVQHLRTLAANEPAALGMHAWLNYLAEMFGGQGLQRALAVPHGAGAVTSFGFDVPVAELMPQALHCLEPAVPADAEHAMIAEARAAYGWSQRLFDAAAASA